jgi:hypothetical protein
LRGDGGIGCGAAHEEHLLARGYGEGVGGRHGAKAPAQNGADCGGEGVLD